MGAKKTVVVVVLIVVIAAALIFLARKSGMGGGVKPGVAVTGQMLERIDANTGELVTKTLAEWEKLGQKDGKYKNPKSGEYTMVNAMVCKACRQTIPVLGVMSPCPKCGKNPYTGK